MKNQPEGKGSKNNEGDICDMFLSCKKNVRVIKSFTAISL